MALALALASAGLKWWAVDQADKPSREPRHGNVSAGKEISDVPALPPSASEVQSRGKVSLIPANSTPGLSPRALRMQADWCGFGAAEAGREERDLATSDDRFTPAEKAAQTGTDGQQVLTLARRRVLQRWSGALRRRGDARSLALAEWVETTEDGALDSRVRGSARLQALAATSTDPMVTVLALKRPCEPGVCRNIEASQWSRLEPENLQAWLALAGTPGHPMDYLLERMATVGRYSRGYQQEAGEMLLSVLQFDEPGLDNQAESELLTGILAAWSIAPFAPLTAICRNPGADAAIPSRCESVATALWSQGNNLERAIALRIAGSAVPKTSPHRAVWEARAVEYEAVRFHDDGRLGAC